MGHKDSVAMADMPAADRALLDEELARNWNKLRIAREPISIKIEMQRSIGKLKAPREMKCRVRLQEKSEFSFFERYQKDLPMIWGLSGAEVLHDPSVDKYSVEIEPADGVKCARCWIYKMDVGADKAWPDICERCAKAVDEWKRQNKVTAGVNG